MSSIEELINAYHLLLIKEDPSSQSPVQVLYSVALRYISLVTNGGPRHIRDVVVPGKPPRHVTARRCSRCRQQVLDNAFAYYAKIDPRYYVAAQVSECWHENCGGQSMLVSKNPHQPHRRNLREYLSLIKIAPWEEYFLRGPADELPRSGMPVEVRCDKCETQTVDEIPRWTAHPVPKYVIRQNKCKSCQESPTWEVVDTSIQTITIASLSRHWKKFQDNGIDLTQYPRRCHIYWSKASMITKKQQLEEERAKEEAEVAT